MEEQQNSTQQEQNESTPIQNTPQKTGTSSALAIVGLVLGILALILSFIPCIGVYAIVPGSIGIVLAAIAFSKNSKANEPKGLSLAGLIISILATVIAIVWYIAIYSAADNLKDFSNDLQKASEQLQETADQMDEAEEVIDDTMEESATEDMENTEERDVSILVSDYIKSGDYDKALDEYEASVDKLYEVSKKAEEGDIGAAVNVVAYGTKIAAMIAQFGLVSSKMTEEQMNRFDEINKKYDEINKDKEE